MMLRDSLTRAMIKYGTSAYYPSMMIEYGYESRNIQDPEKFADMYHTRLKYKAMKDKRANPLKVAINSVYGAMKDRFNPLYDPRQANSVCVTGQLLLLDLLEHLEYSRICDVINSNTDGVLIKLNSDDDYEKFIAVCNEWQQRSGMNLEFDEYVEVWFKDVNNYVIIAADGSYKSKGAYVKKLNDLEYDLPIVNKALINYMVHGINIAKTIYECDDLREFQKIVKISNKYLYGVHNGEMLQDTTFRVFASNDESDTTIFKVKDKNGREVPEKFANTPDHCFIYNDDVLSVGCLPEKLDKSWYVDLAYKRLGDFVNE